MRAAISKRRANGGDEAARWDRAATEAPRGLRDYSSRCTRAPIGAAVGRQIVVRLEAKVRARSADTVVMGRAPSAKCTDRSATPRASTAEQFDAQDADSFLDDVPTVPRMNSLGRAELMMVAANENTPHLPSYAPFERMVRAVISAALHGCSEDSELTNAVLTASCRRACGRDD